MKMNGKKMRDKYLGILTFLLKHTHSVMMDLKENCLSFVEADDDLLVNVRINFSAVLFS